MKIGITERGDGGLDQSWRIKLANKEVDGAIIITKAPHLIKDLPDNTVLHCTITGHGSFWLEPNVITPDEAYKEYHRLISMYGGERVVLRIDPIIPYWNNDDFAFWVLRQAKGRVRISFLDLYPHVRRRIAEVKPELISHKLLFHAPLVVRQKIWEKMGKPEICGEPDMPCAGCVSPRDVIAMGLDPKQLTGKNKNQRPTCACIAEKTELLNNRTRCPHQCLYCYWKD